MHALTQMLFFNVIQTVLCLKLAFGQVVDLPFQALGVFELLHLLQFQQFVLLKLLSLITWLLDCN